jgi:archaellum biogenesis protein FlaJ (TadC family)
MPFRPKRLRMLDRVARYILFLICGMSFLPVILPYFILNNERFITDTVAYSLEIALLYIVPGVLGLIIGKLGLMEIKNIEEYDSVYPVFISVLGEAASLAGSLKEGLRRILKNDYGRLTYAIRRLYYRLNMDVDSKVAWRLFYEELGSNLIRYLTRIFIDAVSRGANIKESSLVIYDTSVRFAKRRHGRTQIFNYFKGMAIPLQATFVAVLTLIVVLISLFTRFSATISSFILYIEVPDISLLLIFVYLMMTIISIGNSWAIYLLKGDSIYTFIYYLGLSLIISGGMFALMAIGSSSILEAFIRFERGLGNVFIP